MSNFSLQAFMAAQNAGQALNIETDNRRADVQMKQQQIAQSKQTMAVQQAQQQQQQDAQAKMTKAIEDFDKYNSSKQVDEGTSPDELKLKSMEDSADFYEKVGKTMLASNPALAESMIKLSDSTRTRRSSLEKSNLEISEKKSKDTAAYAGTVLSGTQTPEEAFSWTVKHVGLKEAMAIPKDPIQADLYWKAKQTQGLTAAEQITNLRLTKTEQDRAIEKKEALSERRREYDDRARDRALSREILAEGQKSRKEELALRHQERAEALAAKTAGGAAGAGGNIQFRNTVAAVNYAAESVRGLDLVSEMRSGLTSGVFGHLAAGEGIPSAMAKTLGNRMTTQEQQIYQTGVKGLGLELAQLATAGSGRGANQAVTKELASMIEVIPGDTHITQMYKLANAADFVRVRLKAVPKSSDPTIQATREEVDQALKKYPTPSTILKAAEKAGLSLDKGKMAKKRINLMEALTKAETSVNAKPARSAEEQSLMDKYK